MTNWKDKKVKCNFLGSFKNYSARSASTRREESEKTLQILDRHLLTVMYLTAQNYNAHQDHSNAYDKLRQ